MTYVQRLIFVVVVLMLAFADAIRALPEPSNDPVALCPNYDRIYVMDAHWDSAKRTKRVTKVLPATCGDTTAVTYGFLR